MSDKLNLTNSLTIALGDVCTCNLKDLQKIIEETLYNYSITKLENTLPTQQKGGITNFLMQKFAENKIAQGMNPKTLKQYIYAIRSFCDWMGKDINLATTDDIIKYLDHYRIYGNRHNGEIKPISDTSLKNKYLLLSSVFGFLETYKYIGENPMNLVSSPKAKPRNKKPLTTKEKETIVVSCEKYLSDKEQARAIALFALFCESGIRVSEASNMNISDVDFEHKTAIVRNGKGNKYREVVFGDFASVRLQEYLKQRVDIKNDKEGYNFHQDTPLFVAIKAPYNRMKVDALRNVINRIRDVSNINRLHPHLLRATCATDLLQNGVPITVVAEQLGHDSITTTSIYTKISVDSRRQLIQSAI